MCTAAGLGGKATICCHRYTSFVRCVHGAAVPLEEVKRPTLLVFNATTPCIVLGVSHITRSRCTPVLWVPVYYG
jgi:hypothetical protein